MKQLQSTRSTDYSGLHEKASFVNLASVSYKTEYMRHIPQEDVDEAADVGMSQAPVA